MYRCVVGSLAYGLDNANCPNGLTTKRRITSSSKRREMAGSINFESSMSTGNMVTGD